MDTPTNIVRLRQPRRWRASALQEEVTKQTSLNGGTLRDQALADPAG